MDLSSYDIILVNSSAGKDSQVMLDHVHKLAVAQGQVAKLVVVHCDLGRVEWKGTRELAESQTAHYGARFEVVSRRQGDLLQHVEQRGKWPSPKVRYCTSDHKRNQVYRVMTKLVQEHKSIWSRKGEHRPVRVLNCMGMRAQESPARSKLLPFAFDEDASNGRRHVDNWLPIHTWTTAEVWSKIKATGVPHHRAYDLGMPRLSCCFCIFAPKAALVLAGKHNKELLQAYVDVEKKIGHKFKINLTLAEVQRAVNADEPATVGVANWCM